MPSFQMTTVIFIFLAGMILGGSKAQLSPTFYANTYPNVARSVREVLDQAVQSDIRIGAKLIRAHLHDCMVDVIFIHFLTLVPF